MLTRENLPPQVAQRVARELQKLVIKPLNGIKYLPQEEEYLSEIHAEIRGPEDTPYENGYFTVKLTLTESFPEQPPRGMFLTKIFHPNVSQPAGDICVNTLKKTGCRHLELLMCCKYYEEYARRAKLWTNIHAPKRSAVAIEEIAETTSGEEKKKNCGYDRNGKGYRYKRSADAATASLEDRKDTAFSTLVVKKQKNEIDGEAFRKEMKKANKKKSLKRL
ncbi:unnamed protein product [Peronospora belbahrii]|uniref:UBC core domain-containing protein n=1 Tax=Peronospora belbahrii TaxID=622444 RepID=A0AAU9L6Y0_9STRA|nr:unnamed protein product [Peronospora belbahrii]